MDYLDTLELCSGKSSIWVISIHEEIEAPSAGLMSIRENKIKDDDKDEDDDEAEVGCVTLTGLFI